MAMADDIMNLIRRFHDKIAANVISAENKNGVLEIPLDDYDSLFEVDLETL